MDDGSEDDTLATVKGAIAQGRRRARGPIAASCIPLQQNVGLFSARRSGMAKATGDYVLFLDADDELESFAIQRLEDALGTNPVDVLGFPYRCVREGTGDLGQMEPATKFSLDALAHGRATQTVFARCYSHDLVRRALPYCEDRWCVLAEDVVYSVIFSVLATSYSTLGEPLYRYWAGGGISTCEQLTPPERLVQLASLVNARDMCERFVGLACPDNLPLVRDLVAAIVGQNCQRVLESPYTDAAKLLLLNYIDQQFQTNYAIEFHRGHPTL